MGAEESLVFGRFVADRRVGAGGMGVVYRGHERSSAAEVAIKVLEHGDAHAAARFEREASVLAELAHPAIVGYVEHGVTDDARRYLVMEWLDGVDLRARLATSVLPLPEALALGARMADALAFAHRRGVLHRDFKPSNVFLPGGRVEDAKLIDFGLARIVGDDVRLTRGGARVGTAAYMSPEQVRGERHIDARADLFALGAVLFECVAGRPPQEGGSGMAVMAKRLLEDAPRLASLRPDVPAALDDLVAQLLARDIGLRPTDAAHVAATLAALAAGREPPAQPARAASPRATLGDDEGRLVCVVLSVAPEQRSSSHTVAADATEVGESDTGEASQDAPLVERIATLAKRHGARMEPLLNGSFAAVLSSAGAAATDLGVRGARFALGLRELVESSRLAMTIGAAVLSRPLALDAIIETVAQLAAEPAPPGAGAGIRLDGTAAGLVGERYELLRDAHGLVLAGERARPDDSGRRLLGKRTPFVGRARELRMLRAALAEGLGDGGPRAVVVSGAAGIGKSRLVAELVRTLDRDDVVVWTGRGDPLRQLTPHGLIAPTLRAAAGIEEAAPVEVARARLAELARGVDAEERTRVVEFLGELCGLAPPADASAQLVAARDSPLLLADQLQRAFEDLVLALTAARPLLLVLEDLHWSDAPSVKLADAALRVARDRPLVVLATTRPEAAGKPVFDEREATRVVLGELAPRASARLVAAVLGKKAERSEIERLAARGAGNALYLEELIRAAAEGGGRAGELPGSVKAMAMARLDALDAPARRVLRAGSVFGESFSPRGVAALLGEAAVGLDELLARLREREWLGFQPQAGAGAVASAASAAGAPEDRPHRFRHDVLREAAYAALTDTDRRLGHRLAGEWLERHGERNAATLATHFERGGDRVRAGLFHARAAEQALAASDLGAALEHAASAAACGARGEQLGELRLVEAVAHHWRAAHDAEHRAAMEALRLLPPLGAAWYRAVEELAEASLPLSDVDTLVALADALEEAPEALREGSGPRTAFRTAAATLTMQLALAGRREAALAVMARLEASLADGAPPPPLARARTEFARATLAMIDGDLGRVIERARAAVLAFEEAGDLRDAALMRSNLAWALAEIGAWAEAEPELRAAAAVAERMGLAFVLGGVKNNLGLVLARRGQLAEALLAEEESVAFYRGVANQRREGQSRIYLAMIHLVAGDLDAAEREARAAVAKLAPIRPTHAHALAQLAQVLLARDDVAEAALAATEAGTILDELGGIDEGEALVRLMRAETYERGGQRDAARAVIGDAKQRLLAKAARISDEAWRERFLGGVPENARTLKLAEECGA